MPNKSFGIYNSGEEVAVQAGDNLVLEVGKTHIACMLKQQDRTISAFELFTFNEHEALNFRELFAAVATRSQVLNKEVSASCIFINNEISLLVPAFKFNKNVADDYLTVVFGKDSLSQTQFEHVATEPEVMNVFKTTTGNYNILNGSLTNPAYRHTYSNILKSLAEAAPSFPDDFAAVRFYNTYFNVAVFKNRQFHLIQTFMYELPEDVIYHLLNIKERLALNDDELVVQVSGMIDLNFNLYKELVKYFKNITVENVDLSLTSLDIKDYPLHYFTPFFNLAK